MSTTKAKKATKPAATKKPAAPKGGALAKWINEVQAVTGFSDADLASAIRLSQTWFRRAKSSVYSNLKPDEVAKLASGLRVDEEVIRRLDEEDRTAYCKILKAGMSKLKAIKTLQEKEKATPTTGKQETA